MACDVIDDLLTYVYFRKVVRLEKSQVIVATLLNVKSLKFLLLGKVGNNKILQNILTHVKTNLTIPGIIMRNKLNSFVIKIISIEHDY